MAQCAIVRRPDESPFLTEEKRAHMTDVQTRPDPAGEEWPETLEPMSDTYNGEPFLGPWG